MPAGRPTKLTQDDFETKVTLWEFEIRYQNLRTGDIDYKTIIAETYNEAASNFRFVNPECLIDEIERSDYFPYTQKFFFGQDYRGNYARRPTN